MAENSSTVVDIAKRFFDRHSYGACEELLHEHIKSDRMDLKARILLSETHERLGSPERALQEYRNTLMLAHAGGIDIGDVEQRIAKLEKTISSLKEFDPDRLYEEEYHIQERNESSIEFKRRISPYFGFPEFPVQETHSNYGFITMPGFEGKTLPYIPAVREEEYIVGVFGGSIASAFYQSTVSELTKALQAHPDLSGRRVVILNFAMGALKQPQTLFYLAYFVSIGQPLDLVINIDGLNDLAGCAGNLNHGHHMAMPPADITNVFSALLEVPKLNESVLEYFLKIRRYDILIEKMESGVIPFAKAFGFVERYKRKRHLLASKKPEVRNRDELMWIHRVNPVKFTQLNDSDFNLLMAEIAGFWCRSTKMMVSICREMSISYIHCLHPSHFLMEGELSPGDKSLVEGTDVSVYRRLVQIGYPELLARMEDAMGDWQDARYCSLLGVLENISDDFLEDAIAHFKPNALSAMATIISRFVLDSKLVRAN